MQPQPKNSFVTVGATVPTSVKERVQAVAAVYGVTIPSVLRSAVQRIADGDVAMLDWLRREVANDRR